MEHRGLAGSASFVSMCAGMLLGNATASLFSYFMSQENLVNWGWRIPFIFALFIGFIGLYIRSHLSESPIYKSAKDSGSLSKYPLKELFKNHFVALIIATGLYLAVTAPFHTSTAFINTFMQTLGYDRMQSSIVSSVILITMIIVFPISASISDKIGRRPVLIAGALSMIVLFYPIFITLGSMNFTF